MIDVRIKDQTILEERELEGNATELLLEVITIASLVLDHCSDSEVLHKVNKTALAESIKRIKYGNIRDGHQEEE